MVGKNMEKIMVAGAVTCAITACAGFLVPSGLL